MSRQPRASLEMSTVGIEIVRNVPAVDPEKAGIGCDLLAVSCALRNAHGTSNTTTRMASILIIVLKCAFSIGGDREYLIQTSLPDRCLIMAISGVNLNCKEFSKYCVNLSESDFIPYTGEDEAL
jgi:hypothetical protein